MNVLVISSWYPSEEKPFAGIFVQAWARCISLTNDVVVMTWQRCEHSLQEAFSISRGVEKGMRTLRIRYRCSPVPGLSHLVLLRAMKAAVEELGTAGWSPDIIHAHVYSSGFFSVLLGSWLGIPVVITEHFSGFARGIVTGIERWKALYAFNRSAFVLPVSENQREALLSFGVRTPMVVVPNPVDVSFFSQLKKAPHKSNLENRKKKLLFVGLLTSIKGLDLLLSALSLVRGVRTDWHLDIVGDGPERENLQAQSRALGLEAFITFHGAKSQEDVARFMRNADAFILPSRWETLPCVVIEALSSGVPVLATRVGGLPELVNAGNGLLVEPENVEALAKGINELLVSLNSYDRDSIAQSAYARYSLEAVNRKLDKLYAEALKQRGI